MSKIPFHIIFHSLLDFNKPLHNKSNKYMHTWEDSELQEWRWPPIKIRNNIRKYSFIESLYIISNCILNLSV